MNLLDSLMAESPIAETDPVLERVLKIGSEILSAHAADVDREARFPCESMRALRDAKLLSAFVPEEYGGMGLNIVLLSRICEVLGQYCSSTAMIYAMHQIQVACIVHHAQKSHFFRDYLYQLVDEQRLIASATTEVGVGGDVRTSLCAVEVSGSRFALTKHAPVISYGEVADDILATCRKVPEAASSDQVQVLLRRTDCTLKALSGWDTMGFRGTCSSGFTLIAEGDAGQIVPVPFSDILTQTMHPVSHILWSALWSGIAIDAVNRARGFVRAEARKTPGETPVAALRLAEVDSLLQEMRHNVSAFTREYQQLLEQGRPDAFNNFGFAIRTNNLKLAASERVVEIVSRAMLICGIAGYRNDSKFSLSRHLRDAYGAAIMVNNDRIRRLNSTLLMVHQEG
jgi:acyl-CoA dehydrogenase